jgi:hypothetical protein
MAKPAVTNGILPRWAIATGAITLAILGWSTFHPAFRPDVTQISPAVRNELGKTGFKATQGVSSAVFETRYVENGPDFAFESRQKIVPIDELVTEKRMRRFSTALTQEFSGLYVGPIAVIRHARNWPPLIGDLLPYHFWTSSRISEFILEQKVNFPHVRGGRLVARITYENRYADGKPAPPERSRLRCDVRDVVEAASFNVRLSGAAARIDCLQLVEADPGAASVHNQDSFGPEYSKFSHWYILSSGWSIGIEGEEAFRAGELAGVNKWQSRLVSFE